MWHTTDVEPREGAKVVAADSEIECARYGEYSDGRITDQYGVSSEFTYYSHWAYAPGEAEHASE